MTGAVAAMGGVGIVSLPLTTQEVGTDDFSLNNNGTTTEDSGGDGRRLNNAAPSNYDVQCTVVSGALASGTTGSYLNLGTTRQWVRTGSAATIRLQIRDAFTLVDVKDVNITLAIP